MNGFSARLLRDLLTVAIEGAYYLGVGVRWLWIRLWDRLRR